MTKPRTKMEKAEAVLDADTMPVDAAAAKHGVHPNSIYNWRHDPDVVALCAKTREELAVDIRATAALAWTELMRRIRTGDIETRDLIIAAGVSIDKSQLLSGGATSRTETRAVTEGLDDHERAALRDAIDAWTSRRPTAEGAGSDTGRTRA